MPVLANILLVFFIFERITMNKQVNVTVSEDKPGVFIAKLFGEIDQLSVNELKEALNANKVEDAQQLVFDLQGVEFMASAGLAVFVYYHETFKERDQNQVLKIINTPPAAMRVFKLTRADTILDIS